MTVAEKRILERAKYLKQQKSKIKPKTEIKTVTKSGSYLYTASAAAGMDLNYIRYPVDAICARQQKWYFQWYWVYPCEWC